MPLIVGTAENDLLVGSAAVDEIQGNEGDDVISGGGGLDSLYGGAGQDLFVNPTGHVYGGDGQDTVERTVDSHNIFWDSSRAGDGDMFVQYVSQDGTYHYAILTSVENFVGGAGNDEFWIDGRTYSFNAYGGDGDDLVGGVIDYHHDNYYGGAGDDNFSTGLGVACDYYGGEGDDYFFTTGSLGIAHHIYGGDGIDAMSLDIDTPFLISDTIDLGSGQIVARENYPNHTYEALTFESIEVFDITNINGNGQPLHILGTDGDDVVYLSANVLDYVYGGLGDDTLIGEEAILFAHTGNAFYGGAGADLLDGGLGDDQLHGDDGDDLLYGGADNDMLDGGAGNDTVSYDGRTAGVTVSLAIAGAQDTGAAGIDTLSGVENLFGTAYNDVLTGDGGDNILAGALGNDVLDGGAGIDWSSYADAGGAVTVSLSVAAQQNTGALGLDTLINIENLLGSAYSDTLTGDGGANRLDGGDGADRLSGLAGSDTLYGGAGDDVIEGGTGNDQIDGGAGEDTASYLSATASVTVNLTLTGAQATGAGQDTLSSIESVVGSAFDDVLAGGAGAMLEGGGGNDALNGSGSIASYAGATAAVTVNLSLGAVQNTGGAGTDTFSGIAGLRGSAFNDTLVGDSGDNLLEGGGGNDLLNGGAGIDTASYAHSSLHVLVDLSIVGPQATSGAGVDTLVGIENLIGTRFTDELRGNAGANRIVGNGGGSDGTVGGGDSLYGGGGDDILLLGFGGGMLSGDDGNDQLYGGIDSDNIYGGAGADYMAGGAGGDIYFVDNVGDQVVEGVGGGQDAIHSQVDYVLPDNVEVLYLNDSSAISGTGNGGDNEIQGNNQGNLLSGGGGDDVLRGQYGDDLLTGGAGNDHLYGDFGWDVAAYAAHSTEATWKVNDDGTVAVTVAGEGVDTLGGIEALRFADRTVMLDLQGPARSDFNGDGKSDVLWRNDSGELYVWNSQSGQGAFLGQTLGFTDNSWQVQLTADFNGDGRADVLWRNLTGEAYVSLAVSDGATEHLEGQSLGPVDGSWVIQPWSSDFNGDGRADILFRNSATGEVYLWASKGVGDTVAFNGQSLGTTPLAWQIEGVADFNGDGRSDILWRNTSGEVYLQDSTMTGQVSLTGQSLGLVGSGWTIEGVGDFDGNGAADVLWRYTSGELYVWNVYPYLGGNPAVAAMVSFEGASLGMVALDWQVAAIGDYDGDHRSDVLWRNVNGDVYVWNSNDTGATGFVGQGLGHTPLDWHILPDGHG